MYFIFNMHVFFLFYVEVGFKCSIQYVYIGQPLILGLGYIVFADMP